MKKSSVLSLSVLFVASVIFTSCGGSKESAYRKVYEKAQAQAEATVQQPATETAVVRNSAATSLKKRFCRKLLNIWA